MATTRINDKVSQLVSSQLPEFISAEYTTFVAFVEAYYRFLEQDQSALELVQNARSYSDIDTTTSDFVKYFLTNYINDIPASVLANKRMLVKRINDIYTSKGSNLSFKNLFRVLYDAEVDVYHPYETVLRPSDGIWEQRVSLRVSRLSGSADDIQDRILRFQINNILYEEPIVRVKELTSDLYEVFLKSTSTAPYVIDGTVTVSNGAGTVIFTGLIKPTATNYIITSPGIGFRVGQIFNINIAGAVDTLVKVLRVSSTGGIELLKIINFGYGFISNITIDLYNDLSVATRTESFLTKTSGFRETFTILSPHTSNNAARYFFSDYVEEEYTGSILLTSSSSQPVTGGTTRTTVLDPAVAIITFTIGAVAKYPGQYISSKGFVSEPEVRLQDGNLYQPFAYELESEIDINTFYDVVKKIAHPAGNKLFANRVITKTIDTTTTINVVHTTAVVEL